jgi:hypothetical protein
LNGFELWWISGQMFREYNLKFGGGGDYFLELKIGLNKSSYFLG